jgi:CRP/FNR family cyclic AMP-dependent transcriptional regulator
MKAIMDTPENGLGAKVVIDLSVAKRARRSGKKARVPLDGCPACKNRHVGWFCSLGGELLSTLELLSTPLTASPSQQIFMQGQDAEQIYVVCGGFVKLTASSARGRKMIVRIAGPGSVLGLNGAVSNSAYEVSAHTLSEVQLRSVRRDDFLEFVKNQEELRQRVVHCLCQEYRVALQDACRVALTDSVAARLARLLLELGQQIGEQTDEGLRLPLLLTHEELASMTCTTRETITRTLGHFRKNGSLAIEGSTVTLLRPDVLEALC